MNQIQKLLARITGLAQAERARYEFSHEIFGRRPVDMSALQTPACWRRTRQCGRTAMA